MPDVEAVVLTGGASTRMGADKAKLDVGGEPQGQAIARRLHERGHRVTICGRERIPGFDFRPDSEAFGGPLAALSGFQPSAAYVFVASCDMPRFDARLVDFLLAVMGHADAAIPYVGGMAQPLCALYKANAFAEARVALEEGRRSVMAWLDRLSVRHVTEFELLGASIDFATLAGANTPAEFEALKLDRIGYFEALVQLIEHAPATRYEYVPIDELNGRILGEPVVALRDQPPFEASAVDGFAVAAADLASISRGEARLQVQQRVFAGAAEPPLRVTPGNCAFVMTGAPVPAETAAIIMREQVVIDGDYAHLSAPAAVGDHIRRQGEECGAGALLVRAGVRATPAIVAAAASTGKKAWRVGVCPRVALVVTGDELVEVGQELGEFSVYESHTVAISAALARIGARPSMRARVADSVDAITAALESALAECDVVITTGGVSVGEHDFVRQALSSLGYEAVFGGVRLKPGRPTQFSIANGHPAKFVFSLPGSPGAALIGFKVLVEPFLLEATGVTKAAPQFVPAVLTERLSSRRGITEFLPVTLGVDGSKLHATPLDARGAHMFSGLAGADALAMIPELTTELIEGAVIPVTTWP